MSRAIFFFVICPRQVNNFNVTMYFPTLILEDGFEIQTTLRSFLKIAFITELNTFCTFVFHKMWNFENNLNTKFINVILMSSTENSAPAQFWVPDKNGKCQETRMLPRWVVLRYSLKRFIHFALAFCYCIIRGADWQFQYPT